MTLAAFACPVEPLRAANCSLTMGGCTAMAPTSTSCSRGGRTMPSARRGDCRVAGEHLLQRALVAARRFGSGVFLSAVSAASMRAIRRTAVCLKDAGQTRLEGILARPRFVPDPRWTRKGVPRDRPGRPRGRLTRALVWAAVAHRQRERDTVVSKLGTLIVRARALGPWRWRGARGGGGDGTASLMTPRRVRRWGAGPGGAAAAIQDRRGKDRGSVAVFGDIHDSNQTPDVDIRRSRGSTRDRPTEPFVSVLRSESCGFDEQRRARAGDRGRSRDRV